MIYVASGSTESAIQVNKLKLHMSGYFMILSLLFSLLIGLLLRTDPEKIGVHLKTCSPPPPQPPPHKTPFFVENIHCMQ